MPTKFSAIYERAMYKFTDYSFLFGGANDMRSQSLATINAAKEAALQNYLMSAIVDVQHGCNIDLNDFNLETKQFNIELSNEIIELLALGVAFQWISAKALNSELLKNRIHNSDYKSYSPGNLLSVIETLRDKIGKEFRGKINTYSARNGNVDKRKV